MTDLQKPVSSGFGATTTASEVLEGTDLRGKYVVLTGGHSGLGLEATRALVAAGAQVLIGARNVDAAKLAVSDIADVAVAPLDLGNAASIRAFSQSLLEAGRHIDVLMNSAGIMACPEMRIGNGWEAQFGTNHLGHFALTNLLWPRLVGGSRVVSVSSAGHHMSPIRWSDVQFSEGYDKWLAYGQAKTANALFAVGLDHLGKTSDVRAFSLHPGKIFTPLQRHLTQDEMIAAGWLNDKGLPADPTFKTPQQGAATHVWAATSAKLDGFGGVYCEDVDVAVRAEAAEPFVGVKEYASNLSEAERLWTLSEKLTGVNAF